MNFTDFVTHFIALFIGFMLGMGLMSLLAASNNEEDEHASNPGAESYRGEE